MVPFANWVVCVNEWPSAFVAVVPEAAGAFVSAVLDALFALGVPDLHLWKSTEVDAAVTVLALELPAYVHFEIAVVPCSREAVATFFTVEEEFAIFSDGPVLAHAFIGFFLLRRVCFCVFLEFSALVWLIEWAFEEAFPVGEVLTVEKKGEALWSGVVWVVLKERLYSVGASCEAERGEKCD